MSPLEECQGQVEETQRCRLASSVVECRGHLSREEAVSLEEEAQGQARGTQWYRLVWGGVWCRGHLYGEEFVSLEEA